MTAGDMFLQSGVCVHASQGQWVTDFLSACGRLQCELQGQAVEGRAGDLSLRIELIPSVSSRPLSSVSARCLILKVKSIFSQRLHAFILADAADCVF